MFFLFTMFFYRLSIRAFAGLLLCCSILSNCTNEQPAKPPQSFTRELHLQRPNDTTRNYTIAYVPTSAPRGMIVLLPGYGEMPLQVEQETDIPRTAAAKGFLTIIPALGDWSALYVDTASQQALVRVLREMQAKYSVQDKPLIVGGFSLGGTGAVLYAERALQTASLQPAFSALPKPHALFAIDPPLDFERFSQNAVKAVQRLHLDRTKDIRNDEYLYITTLLAEAFGGGNIYTNATFRAASPYIRTDTALTMIRALARLPIRFYSEPDYRYWRSRDADYDFQSNELDCASMIADLHGVGNTAATLILTENKGVRRTQGNRRHPHSWSLADAEELVRWVEDSIAK